MDELDDVSKEEKIFMNLWNNFIRTNIVLADERIPNKCREFILLHHEQLSKLELRMQLVLHLFNLWDNGLVNSKTILSLLALFDKMTQRRLNSSDHDAFTISSEAEEKKIELPISKA